MSTKKSHQELCPTCGQPKKDNDAQRYFENLSDSAYVRSKLLLPVVGFSSATLWRKVAAGDFPKPHKISDRVTGWRVREVRQWLAEKGVPHG